MKQLNIGISQIVFGAVGIVLAIVSGRATWQFALGMFPTEKELMAVAFLAAFDVAMMAWLLAYLNHAKGALQRGLSAVMTLVAFCCNGYVFYLNQVMFSGINATPSPELVFQAKMFLTGVVFAHVGATLLFNIFSPKAMLAMKEQEAESQIQAKAFEHIDANIDELAAEAGTSHGQRMLANIRHRSAIKADELTADLPQLTAAEPTTAQQPSAANPAIMAELQGVIDALAAQQQQLNAIQQQQPQQHWLDSVLHTADGTYTNGHSKK